MIELISHLPRCAGGYFQTRFDRSSANRILIPLPEGAPLVGRCIELVYSFLDGCVASGQVRLHVWCHSLERVEDALSRVSFDRIGIDSRLFVGESLSKSLLRDSPTKSL